MTEAEVEQATAIGTERYRRAREAGQAPRYGYNEADPEGTDVLGAAAELVVANFLGVEWRAALTVERDVDVEGYHVRATRYATGRLRIHPDDSGIFILVTGTVPNLMIRGCHRAESCKRPEFWDEPQPGRPAWFVPQSELHSIRHLLVAERRRRARGE